MIREIALAGVLTSTGAAKAPPREITLAVELSTQVLRAENAETAHKACEEGCAVKISAAWRAVEREREARIEAENRPAEVPGWFWPVVGVAVGFAAAGATALVVAAN